MKINIIYRYKSYPAFFRAMLLLIGVMIGLLTIGTIIGLVRSPDAAPLFRLGRAIENEQTGQTPYRHDDDIRVFSGLGRLRIPLSNSSTMILSIAFPYPAHDTAFTEELAVKVNEFRTLATEYFSSLPPERLINIDEEAAKQEILQKYNTSLRLGHIETLYFSDMMIISAN